MSFYAQLKVADALLAIIDAAAAATALNAQTMILPPQDFPALAALNVLLIAGDWPKVVVRSEIRPLDQAGAVGAALSAVALLQSRGTIQGSNATAWASFSTAIGILVSAQDISPASATAIAALRTPTVPAWPVVMSADDVLAARALIVS